MVLAAFFINQMNMASQKELFSDSEFLTYCMARRVADIVFDVIKNEKGVFFDDRRNDPVNPRYDRTDGGLLLEFIGDAPNAIHTPWGRWCIHGGASFSNQEAIKNGVSIKKLREGHKKKLLELLPLKQMVTFSEINLFGPLYYIKINGLPDAQRLRVLWQIVDEEHGAITTAHYLEIVQKWQAMTSKWTKEVKSLSLT